MILSICQLVQTLKVPSLSWRIQVSEGNRSYQLNEAEQNDIRHTVTFKEATLFKALEKVNVARIRQTILYKDER